MTNKELVNQIHKKESFLCIGLDTDLEKIPPHLLKVDDPIFAFNKAIIDATHHLCVAYKPNLAFYEAHGHSGWSALEATMTYLNQNHPEIFTIADAKRGDIGNTSTQYAKAFFEDLGFDAVTIAPYMGRDSVEPFLEFKDKHTILLALTSNEGASDFQMKEVAGRELYKQVLETSKGYKNSDNLMYVVGATKASRLSDIREIVPDNFLLIPGIGAQGGDLEQVCRHGLNKNVGLLVNSSRGIIYASAGHDFAEAAAKNAQNLQEVMKAALENLST
jgi:orotidine-5'-phosphate decarboxylase